MVIKKAPGKGVTFLMPSVENIHLSSNEDFDVFGGNML